MQSPSRSTRWYQSVAVKSCGIAFIATHIPLLGLLAVIVLKPDWISPWGVFGVALVLTLAATAFVVSILWRMFEPLRSAADGLNGFMTQGLRFQNATAGGSDEIGRMVGVLVRALAHLDRSRTPLFMNSALAVKNAVPRDGKRAARWFALVEVDQWEALDSGSNLPEMMEVHRAMGRAIEGVLQPGEFSLAWGRGRFLVELNGMGTDTIERLEPLCRHVEADGKDYTASAVLEAEDQGSRSRAAALQRLEHKLFAVRLAGGHAAVA